LKKFIWKRDQGQCQFKTKEGKQCSSSWHLQFDHIVPYALGGGHTRENLRLLCAHHHQLLSREFLSLKG